MKLKNMYNKMIDMSNIFGMFIPGEDLDGKNDEASLEEFRAKPIFHIGMYKKLILNHINFNTKVLKFFKESNNEFDINDIKDNGYIDALKHYSDDELHTALDMGIEFFQKDELYERCALLLKIKQKSKTFLK